MCQIYTVSYSFYEAMLLRGVKRIVVVVFLLLSLLSLRAEEAMDSAHSYHRSIGVKAAFDLNIPGKWTSTDPDAFDSGNIGYGGAVGVVYNVMKDRRWFLESGLMLSYGEFGVDLLVGEICLSGRMSKFDAIVPLTAGYQFGLFDRMRMNVMAGIEGSLCLGGSIGGDADGCGYPLFGSDGLWRRGDLKWGFGAGFVRDNIEINVMMYFGLINMVKRKDVVVPEVVNEKVVRVSCTYYFRQ